VSYTIVRTNGTVLTTIPDGVVNTTSTPLSLPGRNFASYGQIVDTNFVRALENFADTTVPANPIRGQLWYKTDNETLYICPSDGETNPANWYPILTPQTIGNLTVNNLTANANVVANNASITNTLDSNNITTNYLTVNINANIAEANISGVAYVNEVNTRSITTGTRPTLGNIIGAWTVNGRGTVNSIANTSLWVTGGNLVVTDPVNQIGIQTDNYMYANGVPVDFNGTYSNSNVALYLPTYIGNVGDVGSVTVFNGRTLSTGANVTTGTIIGNWTLSAGSKINGLSDIDGANITGTVANAQNAQFANTANVANTVAINAQPNITSVGTLTSLNVNGNITAANITANTGIFSGNGSGLFNIPIANLVGTFPTVDNASNAANANIANTVRVNAQPNITSVGTLTTLVVSGNSQFTGPVANLGQVGNVRILGGAAGQVLSTNGLGGLSWVSAAAADTAITVTANAQPNITSVGTLTSLNVAGNITAGNVYSNAGTIGANLLAGTLTTVSQPNITSLGTLAGLTVSGNASFTGTIVNLGSVANLRIAGGTSGQVLTSTGSGGLAWSSGVAASTAITVTGNAQPNITSVGTLTSLDVSGNIAAGNVSVTGRFLGNGIGLTNIPGANVTGTVPTASLATIAGTVTTASQPNITSVGTLTSLNVSGNANVGNIGATNFVGSGASLTNLNAGNLSTGTVPSARLSGTYNISISGTAATATTASTANTANTASFATNASNATNATTAVRAGTVTTNAQPNITSVGTLSSLSVSGAITASGNITGSNIDATGSLTRGSQNVVTINEFTTGGTATSGFTRLPNGMFIQYGTASILTDSRYSFISYPTAFTSFSRAIVSGSTQNGSDGRQSGPGVTGTSTTSFTVYWGRDEGGPRTQTVQWIAIGY
jgi:hypothetical protein